MITFSNTHTKHISFSIAKVGRLLLSLGGERNHRKIGLGPTGKRQVKGFNKQKGQQGKKQNKLRKGIHKTSTSACIPRVTANHEDQHMCIQ